MAFIGPWEIALILAIVLILFGGKKLPELARSIGDSIRQYKKAVEGVEPKKNERESILEAAEKLGIDTRGKSVEEIATEITQKIKEEDKQAKN
ncbi:twin-arginine translocase TatA/TatE family subunit [Candidatus Bathyarchaeota archaeon]|nr:twin-arginine translocase TatA/TatE family subunit [Candidatus Bathyarchaeota archaeon]